MSEPDAIRLYANVRLAMKKARKGVLASFGLSEEGLKLVERDAIKQMGGEEVLEVPEGKLMKVHKKVYLHKPTDEFKQTESIYFMEG